MVGTVGMDTGPAPCRLRGDLRSEADEVLRPHRTTRGRLTGRIRIAGPAEEPRECYLDGDRRRRASTEA
ncbi:hypothetical protein ACGFT2_02985 [Streptomyces sp. NPDC048514]|uniref:hypothetical protein n=1 Tax=Streptomyces sp. NPDC048514 TaxID=3365564 RepID=UPI003712518C